MGYPKRNRYRGADKVNRRSDVHGIIPFDTDLDFQNDLPTGYVGRVNHMFVKSKQSSSCSMSSPTKNESI